MQHVLITGGAGFIGSHLAEHLLANGCVVHAFDNFCDSYDPALKRRNVAGLLHHPAFQLHEGDIRCPADLHTLLSCYHFDAVVHLAGLAGVRPSLRRPGDYVDVNIGGTVQVLEAMRQHGVRRLVYGSSSSVYGDASVRPFVEKDRSGQPLSPYAASKLAGEQLCATYHSLYGLDIACLRFFTVYGPRQRPEMAFSKFIDQLLNSQPITLYGDGLASRDFTYVADVVQGICRSLANRPEGFRIYNIGGGQPATLLDVVGCLESLLNRRAPIRFLPDQPGDARHTFADTTKARRELGFVPTVSLREGLLRMVRWYEQVEQPVTVL